MKQQIPINLVCEDELSVAALQRILSYVSVQTDKEYLVGNIYVKNGFGGIKKQITAFNNASKAVPYLVLTDLDNQICPVALISDWLPKDRHHPNLLFRIAIREVEAWLLADEEGLTTFMKSGRGFALGDVETLENPKETLILLAKGSSNRLIREALVPASGSTAKVGRDYNGTLSKFVLEKWNIFRASRNAKSLDRLIEILLNFEPVWRQ